MGTAHQLFQHDNQHGWRRAAIDDTWARLDEHWTEVTLACVRADQTLAYGVEPLRIGRRHLSGQLAKIEDSLPPDRRHERDSARKILHTRTDARHAAEQQLARSQAALDEQLARRWPRRDKTAISQAAEGVEGARQHLAETGRNESEARGHPADLNHHQQARAAALAFTATERHALSHDIGQRDPTLHLTRVDRVRQPPCTPQPSNTPCQPRKHGLELDLGLYRASTPAQLAYDRATITATTSRRKGC